MNKFISILSNNNTNPGATFFAEGVDTLQAGLYVFAAIALVMGIVNWAEARQDSNPASQKMAIGGISAAIIIFIVAYKLVPSLVTFFN